MNPYQSPVLVSESRPWFSGVPLWIKRAAKVVFAVACLGIILGLFNVAFLLWKGTAYNTRDFVGESLGPEARDVYDKLNQGD